MLVLDDRSQFADESIGSSLGRSIARPRGYLREDMVTSYVPFTFGFFLAVKNIREPGVAISRALTRLLLIYNSLVRIEAALD